MKLRDSPESCLSCYFSLLSSRIRCNCAKKPIFSHMKDNQHNQSVQEQFPVGSIVPLSRIDISHTDEIGNAAETSVAKSLLNRKSHCTACGDKDGGCSTCKSGSSPNEENAREVQDNAQDWFVVA